MLTKISDIDKVSIVAFAKEIEKEANTSTISELSRSLKIPLMSENRNREDLIKRILAETPKPETKLKFSLIKKIISFLLEKSGAVQNNKIRKSYAPWFKSFILDLNKEVTFTELAELTNVSTETLMGFSSEKLYLLEKKPIDSKHDLLATAWSGASGRQRKTLESFWFYLGTYFPELSISFKEMRENLIELGLRSPRGPQIKDRGALVKKPFAPHAIWEGDGKEIKIRINGEEFIFSWYAFTDQRTTLLVGSNIAKTESSTNFLAAIKEGRDKMGFYSIGILIDNKLADNDYSSISEFCKEHNIVIVKTFPGTPKTNGNIENNFSIFERYVGEINIIGTNPEELACQIAKNIIEVFTQQRNHRERKRLFGKTPIEACKNLLRPEHNRTEIEKLASRLEKKIKSHEINWNLISEARKKFENLTIESENKIKKEIFRYSQNEIVAAEASYLAQISKHPENKYGPEYFLAILRYKREAIAKRTYNEAFRAGIEKANILLSDKYETPEETAENIIAEFLELQNEKSPLRRILRLDALSLWMVGYSTKYSIEELWRLVVGLSEKTLVLNLKWWSSIVEYLNDKIGNLLFNERPKVTPEFKSMTKKLDLDTNNLNCFHNF
jgi:transposase InsO family protein